jgi:YggT family protein
MTLLITFIQVLGRVMNLALLIRVLLSWVPSDPSSPIIRIIHEVTEPVLAPLRRVIPPVGGMDLSPIVAMFVIEMIQRALITLIVSAF